MSDDNHSIARKHIAGHKMFLDDNVISHNCDQVKINKLGDATWKTQCHFNNLFGSVGRATGGTITDNGDDTVNVAAGTGFIKATDSDTVDLLSFDWVANTSVSITDDITYIGVQYNSGSPQVFKTTSFSGFDLDTSFPLGAVFRETVNNAYAYCIMNSPWWVTDGTTNLIERVRAQGKVFRDVTEGGMLISNPATTKLAITAGKIWVLLNEFDMTAIDTSVPTGSFWLMWYHSTEGWKLDNAATDYSVLQWNNTTTTSLQNLNNNWFANIWVYACPGVDKFVLLYPQAQYSNAASAEAESPPTLIPTPLAEDGLLIGRLLIKQGIDAPIEIQSAFDTVFTPAQAADHGNLAGLTDDDHTQYVLVDGTRALTGNWDIGNYTLTANGLTIDGTFTDGVMSIASGALSGVTTLSMSGQLTSTLAIGTAPLVITSTTVCTNLNADLLDGYHAYELTPVGSIVAYGGSVAPTGWSMCDGSAISRSTYSALFDIVGVSYGAGDGSTTFNVPDLRGKFALGKAASGTGNALGDSGGSIDHTHTMSSHTHDMQSHTHTMSNHTHSLSAHTHTMSSHTHSLQSHTHTMSNHLHSLNSHTHTGTTGASNNNTGVTGGLSSKPDNAHGHGYTTGGPNRTNSGTNNNATAGPNTNTSGSNNDATAGPSNDTSGVNNNATAGPNNNTTTSNNNATASNNPPYLVINYIIKY